MRKLAGRFAAAVLAVALAAAILALVFDRGGSADIDPAIPLLLTSLAVLGLAPAGDGPGSAAEPRARPRARAPPLAP